ncbi:MAG: hypothetical protein WCW87_01435 [Candidatus Paceibacterota bacterium]
MNIIVVGFGAIGKRLSQRLKRKGHEVIVLITSGLYRFEKADSLKKLKNCSFRKGADLLFKGEFTADVLFNCMKTIEGGEDSAYVMKKAFEYSKPVISCEKAGFAYNSDLFAEYIGLFGLSGTVGCLSRIPAFLWQVKNCLPTRNFQVQDYFILNAVLNYLFAQLSQSKTLDDSLKEVKRYHYLESGTHNIVEVFNREAFDAFLKTIILFNYCYGLQPSVFPNRKHFVEFNEESVRKHLENGSSERFIVSIVSCSIDNFNSKAEISGGFNFVVKGLNDIHILGCFRNINELGHKGEIYRDLLLYPPNESVAISKVDHTTIITHGSGSGVNVAVEAMIQDAYDLDIDINPLNLEVQ